MFFFPAHAESGKKKSLNLLFPLNFSFSPLAQETRHYPYPHIPCHQDEKIGHPCLNHHPLQTSPIAHLTLRHGRGKMTLSSSAYKYQIRNHSKNRGQFLGREKDKKREEKCFGAKREASCRNGGEKEKNGNREGS